MVHLWIVYCRSILEQSSVIWHSSLTKQNEIDLERTQKTFAKFLLKDKYITYEDAIFKLNLPTLSERRQQLNLKFANKGIENNTLGDLFQTNKKTHKMNTRNINAYKVDQALTERRKKFSVIYMQNQLNLQEKEKRKRKKGIMNSL